MELPDEQGWQLPSPNAAVTRFPFQRSAGTTLPPARNIEMSVETRSKPLIKLCFCLLKHEIKQPNSSSVHSCFLLVCGTRHAVRVVRCLYHLRQICKFTHRKACWLKDHVSPIHFMQKSMAIKIFFFFRKYKKWPCNPITCMAWHWTACAVHPFKIRRGAFFLSPHLPVWGE